MRLERVLLLLLLTVFVGAWKGNQTNGVVASDHVAFFTGAAAAQTNAPAAFTEIFSGTNRRIPASLVGRTQCRVVSGGGVNGVAGTEIRVQYSTDGGSVFNYLDGVDGPAVSVAAHTGPAAIGSYEAIADAAKTETILRIGTFGGNGVASPTFGHLVLECR